MNIEDETQATPKDAPKYMQDRTIAVVEHLKETELADDPIVKQPISINSRLSTGDKLSLISLLKKYQTVFTYEEMPGLDPAMMCHSLNVESSAKLVKQSRRTFHIDFEAQIKVKVEKLIAS